MKISRRISKYTDLEFRRSILFQQVALFILQNYCGVLFYFLYIDSILLERSSFDFTLETIKDGTKMVPSNGKGI